MSARRYATPTAVATASSVGVAGPGVVVDGRVDGGHLQLRVVRARGQQAEVGGGAGAGAQPDRVGAEAAADLRRVEAALADQPQVRRGRLGRPRTGVERDRGQVE